MRSDTRTRHFVERPPTRLFLGRTGSNADCCPMTSTKWFCSFLHVRPPRTVHCSAFISRAAQVNSEVLCFRNRQETHNGPNGQLNISLWGNFFCRMNENKTLKVLLAKNFRSTNYLLFFVRKRFTFNSKFKYWSSDNGHLFNTSFTLTIMLV